MINWITAKRQNTGISFWWNALGGAISAGQSAILLIFISHRIGITTAGIVTISYAVANVFSSIARYGMRNYQVTDHNNKYSFGDYLYNRILITAITILIAAAYLIWCYYANGDTTSKLMILGEIIVLKLLDSFEDVFLGRYQQMGYFGSGAKIMAIRLSLSTGLMCILLLIRINVYVSLFAGICISILADLYLICSTFQVTQSKIGSFNSGHVWELTKKCLPLCIGTTLSIYIGNVPKYMIDHYMDETIQAKFGYIMMPVFVVMLFNTFIYQPVIKELGDMWKNDQRLLFYKKIIHQCRLIAVMTVVVVLVGMTVGLPVLSVIYNVDLNRCRLEFLILLIGRGFYAFAYYLNVPITTMRMQRHIAYGYIIAAMFSLLTGRYFVTHYGMLGASVLYLFINILLSAMYFIVLQIGLKKERK